MVASEGERKGKGRLFNKITTENFPSLEKDMVIQSREHKLPLIDLIKKTFL
jgi:hypothetical protein